MNGMHSVSTPGGKAPEISVAMGIYNCAQTLEAAVESILKQSFSNFELILCDDGSTDSTLLLAQGLAARDTRIRVVTNGKNLGLNHSLNHCLKLARGRYYARMDGDDISTPNRLERLFSTMESEKKWAVVGSWVEFFDERGTHRTVMAKEHPGVDDLITQTPFVHASCMIRTDILRSLGGYGTESWLRRAQDYHLWFRLYAAGHRGMNLQEVLYHVRDDQVAAQRRTWAARLTEARIMWTGYGLLRIPFYHYWRITRPLILGLMPQWLYTALRRRLNKS